MSNAAGMIFVAAKPDGIEKAFEKALFAAREQILTDCNYYVRVDQGILRDTAYASTEGMELAITWPQEYAQRVYYTGTPSPAVNPNASLMWAEKAANNFGGDWQEILQKGFEK